jgi:ribosome maturation factor RimP
MQMGLQAVVEQCVTDLGYGLVDIEHASGGLVRVFIDVIPGSGSGHVRIEDCERVSRQLTHLFVVENIDYARLEISSPGLDRPLKTAVDFERFQGCEASVRLRMPFQGRRNFEGVITIEEGGRYGLLLNDERAATNGADGRPGKGGRVGKRPGQGGKGDDTGKAADPVMPCVTTEVSRKLVFALDEI